MVLHCTSCDVEVLVGGDLEDREEEDLAIVVDACTCREEDGATTKRKRKGEGGLDVVAS